MATVYLSKCDVCGVELRDDHPHWLKVDARFADADPRPYVPTVLLCSPACSIEWVYRTWETST